MLGAGIDEPLALLLRNDQGDLALEVEMLLSANTKFPASLMGRRLNLVVCIAALKYDSR
jgi:hypothetical protein